MGINVINGPLLAVYTGGRSYPHTQGQSCDEWYLLPGEEKKYMLAD